MIKQYVAVELLLPQFSFLFFIFVILHFRQFNCHNSIFLFFLFLAISLPKFLYLSSTSITSFLYPLSYFFSKFWQWCCQNSFLSSFCQISLNSIHITIKLHFLQYLAKKLQIWPNHVQYGTQ